MTTLSESARNAACDATVLLIDQGFNGFAPRLVLRTAGEQEVASLDLSFPAFNSAVSGVATANPITSDTNAVGGLATIFTIEDLDGNEVLRGTVSGPGGGGDIELSGGNNITAGATVDITSLTHTQPA